MGPVKQWVDQQVNEPLTVTVYPGADGGFTMYEDDGRTFDYRRGEWMGVEMTWRDSARSLSLRLARGSRMRLPSPRPVEARVIDGGARTITFHGKPMTVTLSRL